MSKPTPPKKEAIMYAIISDIHGNYPALAAVLRDAKAQGAENFLLLGDYTNSFPFHNEIVETLRNLPNTTAIRGNHETYLTHIHEMVLTGNTREILNNPLHWSYARHTPEDFAFITQLPETAQISDKGGNIQLAHEVQQYIPSPTLYTGPSAYADLMREKPFTFQTFLTYASQWLLDNPTVVDALRQLPMGVYLFGHSHIPLHINFEGRWLINPGSCGFTCDHDTRAAYALLESVPLQDGNYSWHVTQRRVEYDMNEVVEAVRKSDFKEKFPEFCEALLEQLRHGDDAIFRYVRSVSS